jgi:hypothetical protein
MKTVVLMQVFFCRGDWHVSVLTLPIGFRVVLKKTFFVTCYDPMKKLVQFQAIQTLLLTHPSDMLFDHYSFLEPPMHTFCHIQILCNNGGPYIHLILSSSAIIRNVLTLILTNESPHMVNVCVCSHRDTVVRLQFVFYHFSPIYKVFVPPRYLSTWQNRYQMLSGPFHRHWQHLPSAWRKTWLHNFT